MQTKEHIEFEAVLRKRFGDKLVSCFDNFSIQINNDVFFNTMAELKETYNFSLLLDICGVDNSKRDQTNQKRFECVYHLLSMETNSRLRVKVQLSENEKIKSVVSLWKTADWFERETSEMYGIKFGEGLLERLLTHQGFKGHPLRKDYPIDRPSPMNKEATLKLPVDHSIGLAQKESRSLEYLWPTHPAINGSLRILCEVDGDVIKRSQSEIGFLHRCFEKICEQRDYNQIIPFTDRLNYCSAAMNNIGWCKAVEDLLEVNIPDRAKALRMVYAELSRIVDHLFCIGAWAVDVGALSNYWFCLELREKIYELFERVCGARVTVSLTRIGGLSNDLPPGWISQCMQVIKSVAKDIEKIDRLLSKSKIWIDRTSVGKISKSDAIQWGYTGPCLRATGVNFDIRKSSPYYFYDQMDFEVPLGINGDCFDRYLVRIEEIRQSIKIISQVLNNLPTGDYKVDDKRVSLPEKNDVYRNIDALMNHFMLIMKGIKPKKNEIYSATEAANGELGFYIISDGSSKPYRVKLRPPCFPIYQSFSELTQETYIEDALTILCSMNIVAGELDR